MKKIFITLALVFSVQAYAKADSKKITNEGFSKEVIVNGMVCAFCSNSLEKKFKKEKAVERLNVDLDNKKVSIKFKKGKVISDKKLKRLITSSGFSVVEIKTPSGSGN